MRLDIKMLILVFCKFLREGFEYMSEYEVLKMENVNKRIQTLDGVKFLECEIGDIKWIFIEINGSLNHDLFKFVENTVNKNPEYKFLHSSQIDFNTAKIINQITDLYNKKSLELIQL